MYNQRRVLLFVQDVIKQSFNLKNSPSQILLEPSGCNTALAMACATFLSNMSQESLLLFLPSDHYIPDVADFISTIQSGVSAVEAGYNVTFGVQPSFPSVAYGFIQQGEPLNAGNDATSNAYVITHFIENQC